MTKKQTRRSISVRGVTYDRLRDHCAGASISMSDFVEQRIAEYFAGRPALASVAAPAQPKAAPVRAVPAPPPPARVAVARTERSPLPPVRAVPATSSIAIKKPQQPVAMKISSPAPVRTSVGRPAPTPASRVLKVRQAVSDEDTDDYRAIRF